MYIIYKYRNGNHSFFMGCVIKKVWRLLIQMYPRDVSGSRGKSATGAGKVEYVRREDDYLYFYFCRWSFYVLSLFLSHLSCAFQNNPKHLSSWVKGTTGKRYTFFLRESFCSKLSWHWRMFIVEWTLRSSNPTSSYPSRGSDKFLLEPFER